MNSHALPGPGTEVAAAYRNILVSQDGLLLQPGGVIVDGSESRDPLNTGYIDVLRCGLLMGKRTANSLFAPSILGVLTAAYTSGGTTLTVSAATATEIARRVGSSGTLYCIGPPSAAGTVAKTSVTFSAVDTSTGAITVTSLGVNKISGSFITDADGSETIRGILGLEDGLKVTDDLDADIDVALPRLILGGQIDASQIINWPSDTSLVAYVKAALRAVGGAYTFDDDI